MVKLLAHMVMAVFPVRDGNPVELRDKVGVTVPGGVVDDFMIHAVDTTSSKCFPELRYLFDFY